MKLKPSQYFLLVLIALMLIVIGVTLINIPYLEAQLFPIVLAAMVVILSVIELLRELRTPDRPTISPQKREAPAGGASAGRWLILIWLSAFSLLIYLFGFIIAIPLFIAFWVKLHGRGWVATVLLSGLTTFFIYAVFVRALHITLYEGVLF